MKLSIFIVAAAIGGLAACATPDGEKTATGVDFYEGDPRLGAATRSACIGSEIDGFRETRRSSVIIEGRGRREFLLTTRACFNLDSAFQLGVDARGGCLSRGDRIFVADTSAPVHHGSGNDLETCIITGIYDWNEAALKPEAVNQSPDRN